MIELSAQLPRDALVFVLLLTRIGAAIMLLPGFGEATVPAMVRAGMALAVTLLLLPSLLGQGPAVPEAGLQLASMLGAEAVTGLWFGWLARMAIMALPIGAQFIAYLLGLSSVLQPDPELGPQTTALARLAEIIGPLVILVSGLYQVSLAALAGTFRLVPMGAWLPAADGLQTAVLVSAQSLALALRLAAPFVIAGVVFQLAAGLIARMVPRLQVYMAVMPGQILGGLALLAAASTALVSTWQHGAGEMLGSLPGSP